MRKSGLIVLFLLGGLAATPSMAKDADEVPVCTGVQLLTPADGATLEKNYSARFTWNAEPLKMASGDWMSMRLDANDEGTVTDGVALTAQKGSYTALKRGHPGTYAWFVMFYDAKGAAICMSPSRTYVVADSSF